MGRAGVVLGIEMSRLARTGRDWHQLLELCSLSGVLLADPDGVYDPGVCNDRLLLGLKGTMSEAELFLIRQRMLSGKLAKAERGELILPLPIGYVRRPSGEVVLDPDEQAQHVVRLVFSTFPRLGTLNGVLRYLVEQQVQLPVRVHSGPAKGELEWRRPTRETLQNMLRNPAYAGYYAYGRRQVDPRRKIPGRPGHRAGGEGRQRVAGAAAGPASGLHHRGASTRRTSPGWPPTGRPRPRRARRGTARRCCPGCCAAAAAAGTAWRSATTTRRRAVRLRLHLRVLPGQLRDRRPLPAHRRPRARRLRRPPGPRRGGAGGAGGLHGRRCAGRERAGHAGQAVAAARSSAPATPPTAPAASTSSPSRRTGSSPGSWRPTGKPRSPRRAGWRRTTSGSPSNARRPWPPPSGTRSRSLAADLPRVWDAPSTTRGRPQGAAAHPYRGHHRRPSRATARSSNVDHHLGRRAPDQRAGRPPRRPPGPALVLPGPPRPRHRARRRGPHQQADRRRPQRRGIPAAQADQPSSPASRSAP